MDRLVIIGDSNVYRNVTAERLKRRIGRDVVIVRATKAQSLELGLKEVSKMSCSTLIVSALPNLISDSAAQVSPADLPAVVAETTTRYLSGIAEYTKNVRRVLLVPPLIRTTPAWFVDHLKSINTLLQAHVRTYKNMQLLPEFKVQVTDLLSDGVHLHAESGSRYFDYFVNCCLDLLEIADTDELEMDISQPDSGALTSSALPTTQDIMNLLNTTVVPRLDEISGLRNKITATAETQAARASQDDIMFARHSEELDHLKNERWANRVVVVNFIDKDFPSTLPEKKSRLSAKFGPLIEEILGEIVYDIYPRPSTFDSGTVPPFEIRFPSDQDCRKFKQQAYKLIREKPEVWGDLGFHPKMTLASRVRVEILRAIARKVLSPTQSAYCPIYSVRPILHLGPLVDKKVQRTETLTYVDAVLKFRHLLTINDLGFAYKRLGYGFHNVLRQMFIVLNEEDRATYNATHGRTAGSSENQSKGVKRGQDHQRGRGAPRGKRNR